MTCWCQHVHNKEILDQYRNWGLNDLHFKEWCHETRYVLWLETKWKPIRRGRLSTVQSEKRRAIEFRAGIQWRERVTEICQVLVPKTFHPQTNASSPKSRIESRGVIHHKVAITRDSLTRTARVFRNTIPEQSEIVCGINSLESFGRWGWTEPQAPAQVAPVKHHNLPNMNPSASALTRFSAAPIKSHSRTLPGITPRAAAERAEAATISAAQ